MNDNKTKSYLMLISSMLIFGTIGIFRRYIPLSSALLSCTRGFLGAAILIIFLKIKKVKLVHTIGIKKLLLLALTGALMGANWIFLFEAYNHTTVAVATLCYYMQPTIVIILSPIIFGERLSIKKFFCIIVSLIGMIFVSGIVDGNLQQATNVKGVLFGLLAAALYASVVILNKKIQMEDAYEKTIIQLLSAAIVLVPYLIFTEDFGAIEINVFSIVMILVVGVIHTGIAYAMYFGSMKALSAQSIAVLSYLDPVSALILSAAILKESLTIFGIIGAVMIIGTALFSEVGQKEKHG